MTELLTAKTGIALLTGVTLAVQDLPNNVAVPDVIERVGFGAIAVWLIWWMLNNFAKRLDKLTAAIEKLRDKHE